MSRNGADAPVGGAPGGSARAAWMVGAGIFLSRISGFVRTAVFGNFFGLSAAADVWAVALKTPNLLQNLLGEGTLSASFIPIYARMLEEGREADAGRFAGAALGILASVAYGAALVGVLIAPTFVRLVYRELPGRLDGLGLDVWSQEQVGLAVTVMQVLFLATATLVVSAWALGVLNSHRKFFLSYVAPVVWNGAIITTLVVFGGVYAQGLDRLVVTLAWGALAGSVLQLGVQVPWVVRSLRGFRLSVSRSVQGVREAIDNLVPVVLARGAVNVSGWIDYTLAAFLGTGAVAAMYYAQPLYILPVSLFAMSIAASELPELSREGEGGPELVPRVRVALARVWFLVLPSAVAFLCIGDALLGGLYQWGGEFGSTDTILVYAVLAAYAVGLPASSSSRVLSSAFYALRDTRTPARIAYLRVTVSILAGVSLMLPFNALTLSVERGGADVIRFGAVGLALGSAVAAWIEYPLLRRALTRRIGSHGPGRLGIGGPVVAAASAALAAVGAKAALGSWVPLRPGLLFDALGADSRLLPPVLAVGTAGTFGVVYLAVARVLGGRRAAS